MKWISTVLQATVSATVSVTASVVKMVTARIFQRSTISMISTNDDPSVCSSLSSSPSSPFSPSSSYCRLHSLLILHPGVDFFSDKTLEFQSLCEQRGNWYSVYVTMDHPPHSLEDDQLHSTESWFLAENMNHSNHKGLKHPEPGSKVFVFNESLYIQENSVLFEVICPSFSKQRRGELIQRIQSYGENGLILQSPTAFANPNNIIRSVIEQFNNHRMIRGFEKHVDDLSFIIELARQIQMDKREVIDVIGPLNQTMLLWLYQLHQQIPLQQFHVIRRLCSIQDADEDKNVMCIELQEKSGGKCMFV